MKDANQAKMRSSRKRKANPYNWLKTKRKANIAAGLPHLSTRGKLNKGVPVPTEVLSCSCNYYCKSLSLDDRQQLFLSFRDLDYKEQSSFLLSVIFIRPVKRRRHGTYDDPAESRRQCTIDYVVKDIHVCKSTVLNIFGVSKKRIDGLIKQKKIGVLSPVDNRGKFTKPRVNTEEVHTLIREHIESFPQYESHYTRVKSTHRRYLSMDLSIKKMFRAFHEKHGESMKSVKYQLYYKTFTEEYNLSFKPPKTDTCGTCDKLVIQIKAATQNPGKLKRIKTEQELHHRKAPKSFNSQKADRDEAVKGDEKLVLTVDLEKVIQLPTLTHTEMYYSRQLSCYNLDIHVCNNNDGFMFIWHECLASRGADEIGSCILKFLELLSTTKKHLILWYNNCGGQNKNRQLLFLFMLFILQGKFEIIEHKFALVGHSFLSCDRDFGIVEKQRKVTKLFIPAEVKACVESARPNQPFKGVLLGADDFYDLTAATDSYLVTKDVKIKSASWLKFTKEDPGFVYVKDNLNENTEFRKVALLKRGVTVDDVRTSVLQRKGDPVPLHANKQKDLKKMMEYLDDQYKPFYEYLLN